VRIERILTDCGTEYTTWHEEAIPNHEFKKTCKKLKDKAHYYQSKASLDQWLCGKIK
jgi:hypothetical protein